MARLSPSSAPQANWEQAQAALDAAQVRLAALTIHAPMAGTAAKINPGVGEQVVLGAPLVRLADNSHWYVETDDLTELEVVHIEVGQGATVQPDAIQELELAATVGEIAQVAEEKRGEKTYTVRLKLKESDPRLRWA